jgi:hypothetical protein
VLRLKKSLVQGNWNNVDYVVNRTHLAIMNVENLQCVKNENELLEKDIDIKLTEVKYLYLYTTEPHTQWIIPQTEIDWFTPPPPTGLSLSDIMESLSRALPNVTHIQFCGVIPQTEWYQAHPSTLAIGLNDNFHNLEFFEWPASGWGEGVIQHRLCYNGCEFQNSVNLRQLSVDESRFDPPHWAEPDFANEYSYEADFNAEHYLFNKIPGLTHLSMKDTWYSLEVGEEDDNGYDYVPITQGMLMKMVRLTPTLRWLRSDLTDENVEILRRERPDVTFVSGYD